jgi:phosphoenolpyruvate carboxylase
MGDMKHLSAPAPAKREKDNERPLVEDIRLLGRILGDEIREQEGPAAFELIEKIRKLSVAFRRDADQEADKALKKLLTKALSGDQTVSVIRAFTYFSAIWPIWPKTATTSAAAPSMNALATPRKAALK